jgi:hypothetical protein
MVAARLSASSISPGASAWLRHTRKARVLSVFDRACNLINDHRQVLSIVNPRIGDGPFHLVLDQTLAFSRHVDPESAILTSAEAIIVGEMAVEIQRARVWSPAPDWSSLHEASPRIAAWLQNHGHSIASRAHAGSLMHSPAGDLGASEGPRHSLVGRPADDVKTVSRFAQAAAQPASKLAQAVAAADLEGCGTAARHLAGLGPGSTPSGDDFIVGAAYAACILHSPENARTLAQRMAAAAVPLTTTLSAAWLEAAGRGEAGTGWHRLFAALAQADTSQVLAAVDYLLEIGHTSGADALAGFLGAIRLQAEVHTQQ